MPQGSKDFPLQGGQKNHQQGPGKSKSEKKKAKANKSSTQVVGSSTTASVQSAPPVSKDEIVKEVAAESKQLLQNAKCVVESKNPACESTATQKTVQKKVQFQSPVVPAGEKKGQKQLTQNNSASSKVDKRKSPKQQQQQQQQGTPKKATAKPKASQNEVSEKEEIFQAVLLADNFSFSVFGPESPLRQEGLISLANRKLIDYSLESLTVSGVQEIFIYCSNDVEGIREHISNSRWCSVPNCTIRVIVSEDSLSLGDALRDLDGKGVIKNDFILLSAGVVTNLPLKPLLNRHKEIVKVDKGAVMTLVHRKMLPGHRSRPKHQNTAVVVNSATRKVIAYDHKPTGKRLCIPLESVQDEMDVFTDSVDTGITVCSACVPPLFTDNFDFTCINDFIRGIMINEEILGNSIYMLRLESGYANRVVDFDTYHGISCDILQRWTYPVVPDMPFGSNPNENVYDMGKNFIYKAPNVKTAYGAEIGKSVIIGANTQIEKDSRISESVLGDKCKIEAGVTIVNSHVGNGVQIMSGCKLNRCILTDGTVWKDKTPLEDVLVVNGEAFPIQLPTDGAEDSESDDDSDEDDFDDGISDDEFGEHGGLQEEDFNIFRTEVLESLFRGFRQNVATENLVLEINSSKYAYNMTFKEVTFGVAKGMLSLALKLHPEFQEQFTAKVQWDKIKEVIIKLKDLLAHYTKTEKSQKDLLEAMEEYANDNPGFRPMLMQALHLLYDEDILSEETILDWHKSDSLYDAGAELRVLVTKLVVWLSAADSDSSEEED